MYEFLAGGNLQRSLEGASRPLKWFDRIRVLAQIVDALLFLHHHDPPIVHRDLSPENILLANGTVKLADVGLARLLREDDTVTAGPKGTPGYIDPAEVMSCEVSVLGDVYALGLVGLQLLLGEASIQRLQKRLQETSSGGQERVLHAVLDKLDNSAGDWPMALTRDLALLLVRCADHRRARRPDLAEEVQPLLRQAAERADAQSQREADGLELQLICPLAKVCCMPLGAPLQGPASCHSRRGTVAACVLVFLLLASGSCFARAIKCRTGCVAQGFRICEPQAFPWCPLPCAGAHDRPCACSGWVHV